MRAADASEIFDFEKQKAVVEEKKELNEFMNLMANQVVTGVDVGAILSELDLTQEVRSRVDDYLVKAETEAGVA